MNAMNNEHVILSLGPASDHRQVVMRGPADMAELLPYFLGFYPDDSIVAVGLHGPGLHQGGVIRADLPRSPAQWPAAAEETAALLVALSERHGARPLQVLLYLCQDRGTAHAPPVVDGLRPLAEALRAAFGRRGVAVKEALCVSDGRWWSFLCRGDGCCDAAGNPVRRSPEPGPAAAAATVAGLVPRGSRKAIIGGLDPVGPPADAAQREALARAEAVDALAREQRLALLDQAFAEFRAGARELDADRTAQLLLALRDRLVRDRGVEYARPDELAPAERLWRFLARRAVPPYEGCAVAPLTLLAWTSWVAGDTATARVVLGHVLRLAPGYLLAELLYESLNDGMTPQGLLAAVEAQRRRREEPGDATVPGEEPRPPAGGAPNAEAPPPAQGAPLRDDAGPGPAAPGAGEAPGERPGRSAGARRHRRGGRRKGSSTASVPTDPGQGAPDGSGGPEPDGGGAGAVALLSAPGRAVAPGHARVAGERFARGLRLGRAAACVPAVARTGHHRCRGVRRAAGGGHRAH
ncbi:DUF4192 domain-containing protein [Kitasatospora xanthocidica]|uniref:DUF4192 domain-containing protein n=1 Tax=Kitasatospora xanthocidica TaxID=83382 RepID=A0A373A0E3_9ACTN|nr:DUF4192 domain-containing protein [Kitasatospora xanthocidica]RGD61616.1 DUF4192 domain-containing protein [Kitasatospora xanthocidica]